MFFGVSQLIPFSASLGGTTPFAIIDDELLLGGLVRLATLCNVLTLEDIKTSLTY